MGQCKPFPLPAERNGIDDYAVFIKIQQRRTKKQQQKQQAAFCIQKCSNHILIEADTHRGDISLINLPEERVDQSQNQQLPEHLKQKDLF